MQLNKFFIASLVLFFTVACSSDDTTEGTNPSTSYHNGFFVLNQGSSGEGSVTFVSNDFGRVEQNIFGTANPEEELGLGMFLQSVFFHGNNAYIISNGSNLITVVDRHTFELVGTVEGGLNVPRYGTVVNGTAYVTNQAGFSTTSDDYIAVIDLETLTVEETIMANAPVEFIEEENGKLYVQNASYDMGNQISIVNPATNSIEQSMTFSDNLNSFEIEDNFLYALSSSGIERMNLSTMEIQNFLAIPDSFGSVANLRVEDDQVYFTSGDKVFSVFLVDPVLSTEPLIDYASASQFGSMYGFAVEDNHIYIADAGDFASSSYVQVYDASGNLEKEISVGVAPVGFYFVD